MRSFLTHRISCLENLENISQFRFQLLKKHHEHPENILFLQRINNDINQDSNAENV